jgi:hypothetical protein
VMVMVVLLPAGIQYPARSAQVSSTQRDQLRSPVPSAISSGLQYPARSAQKSWISYSREVAASHHRLIEES